MAGKLKIIDNTAKFLKQSTSAMDRTLNAMVIDVERMAKQQVPFKEGALKASGYHKKIGLLKWVVGFNKVYAAFQEWGGDGKRVVRNYSMPGKKKFYLRDPVAMVHSKALGYFKKEIAKIRV